MKTPEGNIEIVPGKSIGDVRLGMKAKDLPPRAAVDPPAGELDGVRFVFDTEDKIEDIWIDDLRTFVRTVSFRGIPLDKKATVEQLEAVLGECKKVEGVKGAIFYNCTSGVALGVDFSGTTLQIRVKPR
jgi:hypothetical protein